MLADRVVGMAQRSVDLLTSTSTIGIVFGFVIVPFWMFYALRDRHNVARNFMNAVPEPVREDVSNLLAIADWVLLRYVRAQIILGLVVGTAVGVGLTLLDVPLSLALGVIAGVTELNPHHRAVDRCGARHRARRRHGGHRIADQGGGCSTWPSSRWRTCCWCRECRGTLWSCHPAIIILLLVVAAAAFGFVGLVVIVPLTAIAREMFWYIDRRLSGTDAVRALALSHVGARAPAVAIAAGASAPQGRRAGTASGRTPGGGGISRTGRRHVERRVRSESSARFCPGARRASQPSPTHPPTRPRGRSAAA